MEQHSLRISDLLLSPLRLSDLETLIENSVQRGIRNNSSNTPTTPAERVYTKPEAAKFLHIMEQTLNGYVSAGKIPYCKPTDGRVYFLHSDLIDWLKRHRTATTEEATAAYEAQRPARRQRSTSTRKAA